MLFNMRKTDKKSPHTGVWRSYVIQLSVVIVGVMVTFVGSDLIGRWSRAREVRRVMQLVVDELRINRVQLEKVCGKLRYDRNGMLMLQRYEMDLAKIPADSLDYYVRIIGVSESLRPHVDALEVLKTSGVIASVSDKQLLLGVLGCYNRMQSLDKNVETYNGRKMAALDHLFANSDQFYIAENNSRGTWNAFLGNPMCSAFLGCMAYYFGFEDRFDDFLTDIDHTVASINKEYGLE